MINLFVDIGEGVEVGAKDLADFFDEVKAVAEAAVSPQALIAMAILAESIGQVVADATAAAASDGLNIPLDAETVQLIIQTWPEFKAYIQTLAIRPAAPKPATPQGATV
jgi:hypothetical protein